jgi:copper(I)-binding protein
MRCRTTLIALLAALSLVASQPAAAGLVVESPWVAEAPPTARVLAGYMRITNPGEAPVTVTAVSSPDFDSAELHRTVLEDGVASMQPVAQLEIPASGSITLEPGGLHLMLFNPRQPLQAGDTVTLILSHSDGACVTLSAPVVRRTGAGHDHHHHH